jgi:Ser/Thr protein kinase RdoA (MazF antagonist)
MKSFSALSTRGQIHRLKQLAFTALGAYDLIPSRVVAIAHWDNTVFRIDTLTERYVLRISRTDTHKTRTMIQSEIQWLTILHHDLQLDVPQPIPTRNGLLVQECSHPAVPTPRVCTLFRWLSGHVRAPSQFKITMMERFGHLTGRLHQHAQHFIPPPSFVRPILLYADPATPTFAQGLDHSRAFCSAHEHHLICATTARVQDELRGYGQTAAHYGLVHGDLHPWNCVVHGERIGVIDFDDCGWGHYLYDIAAALLHFRDHPEYEALRAAFFRGYRRVRALSDADEQMLSLFYVIRRLVFISWTALRATDPQFRATTESIIANALPDLRSYLGEPAHT